ncbi:uncharacterized protein LOC117119010 [Anneissia japonica]|uniref:uncharacterized protein LOC117119010 n=1 Tax=Anneissia japonica TaxID=1529436 RepID=UPI001425A32C|nr:uncharacterized protein LOC117119010 [Anneissia japonica]
MYLSYGILITFSGLIIFSKVNLACTSESSDDLPQNDATTQHHNAITGFFVIILVLCILVVLLVIIGLCYFFRKRNDNLMDNLDLAYTHSEESFRMSVKAQQEKSCSTICLPEPLPKVRSQSCSDFAPRDDPLRQSFRLPTKKPNINIIIGEEARHCSPYPVPEKMSRRNTIGSSARSTFTPREDTFQCPKRVSTNPFQRQMSLPVSVRSESRVQRNPLYENSQSCPFT